MPTHLDPAFVEPAPVVPVERDTETGDLWSQPVEEPEKPTRKEQERALLNEFIAKAAEYEEVIRREAIRSLVRDGILPTELTVPDRMVEILESFFKQRLAMLGQEGGVTVMRSALRTDILSAILKKDVRALGEIALELLDRYETTSSDGGRLERIRAQDRERKRRQRARQLFCEENAGLIRRMALRELSRDGQPHSEENIRATSRRLGREYFELSEEAT